MTDCYEAGDALHGYRIRAEARKVSDPSVIAKSGRHKAPAHNPDRECRGGHRKEARLDKVKARTGPVQGYGWELLGINSPLCPALWPIPSQESHRSAAMQSHFCERRAESRDHYTASTAALPLWIFPHLPVPLSAASDSYHNFPGSYSRKI